MKMSVPEGVKIEEGGEGTEKTLPLIIRALEGKDSLDYLNGWITSNKSWLQAKMVEHGECHLLPIINHHGHVCVRVYRCCAVERIQH